MPVANKVKRGVDWKKMQRHKEANMPSIDWEEINRHLDKLQRSLEKATERVDEGLTTYQTPTFSSTHIDSIEIVIEGKSIKCPYCGQYGKSHSECMYCGAPIE